ncbi:MAG: hypothetical protein V4641_13010 [Pseudomonadota bacterium]
MTRTTVFRWAYNDAELRSDPAMTRQHAAALLRSWRSLAGYTVKRMRQGHYRVQVGRLAATMVVEAA